MKTATRLYRIREFAAIAGVTVRALHHYDRLGLLQPRRSSKGYRLYTARDLARLEQIVVLKFIGIPLRDIRALLAGRGGLPGALRRQQRVLSAKRALLDRAIRAIAAAERSLGPAGEPDWRAFTAIIEEIEMQNRTEWSRKYYTPEAQARIEEGRARRTPELQAQVTRDWTALYADIEAALADDPAGPAGRALAARWRTLVNGFSGGDPEIQAGLNRMWADQANWPAGLREQYAPKPAIQAWIMKALAAGDRR